MYEELPAYYEGTEMEVFELMDAEGPAFNPRTMV